MGKFSVLIGKKVKKNLDLICISFDIESRVNRIRFFELFMLKKFEEFFSRLMQAKWGVSYMHS